MGSANDQLSARSGNSVPGNSMAARARGHGVTGRACAAGQTESFSQCSVGGHAAAWDFFHEEIEFLPRNFAACLVHRRSPRTIHRVTVLENPRNRGWFFSE